MKFKLRTASLKEGHEVVCCLCGQAGGTLVKIDDDKYRHMGICPPKFTPRIVSPVKAQVIHPNDKKDNIE